jgi:hypothetical protein
MPVKFTIEILPEAEARLIRKPPSSLGASADSMVAVRPNGVCELVGFGLYELQCVAKGRIPVVRVRSNKLPKGLTAKQRQEAGRRIQVELVSTRERDRVLTKRANSRRRDMPFSRLKVLLVERPDGLQLCHCVVRDLRDRPLLPPPVARIVDLEITDAAFSTLGRGRVVSRPRL